MGRKVESAIDTAGYKACLEGDFIIDTLITNASLFTLIGNIKLKQMNFGSHGAIRTIQNLRLSFQQGKEYRMKPPNHYKEHLSKLNNFHPEEYFEMKDFER